MSSPSTALATQDATQAIMAAQEEESAEITVRVPILKVCQGLTAEVKAGDAEAGEFLNTLTGESLGTKVEFIVAYYQPGRSASDKKSGRYYVSVGESLIPESWADLVGEEFVGTPFDEYPDAEEQYKARVNRGDIEWGSGPLVSTTYNYTGLVVVPVLDDEGKDTGETDLQPVRIGFLRTTKSAHEKIQMLKKAALRNRPFWDIVFEFSTKEREFGRNSAFVVNVKQSRRTNDEEKALAVEVAQAVLGGRVDANEEASQDKTVAPDAKGGLDV